jgi:hypothetical protein
MIWRSRKADNAERVECSGSVAEWLLLMGFLSVLLPVMPLIPARDGDHHPLDYRIEG